MGDTLNSPSWSGRPLSTHSSLFTKCRGTKNSPLKKKKNLAGMDISAPAKVGAERAKSMALKGLIAVKTMVANDLAEGEQVKN